MQAFERNLSDLFRKLTRNAAEQAPSSMVSGASTPKLPRKGGRNTVATSEHLLLVSRPSLGSDSSDGGSAPTSPSSSSGAQTSLRSHFVAKNPMSAAARATSLRALLNLSISTADGRKLTDNQYMHAFGASLHGGFYFPYGSAWFDQAVTTEAVYYEIEQRRLCREAGGNLTLSTDGQTLPGSVEIYPTHITLPTSRGFESFLLNGHDINGDGTDGQSLFDLFLPDIEAIGPELFSAFVSDSAANVRKVRRMVADKYKWILSMPDVCHIFNLLVKDVLSHPELKDVLKGLAAVCAFFSASLTSAAELIA